MAIDTPKNAFRPTIGITMGDPAGIGAEVIVKALADESLRSRARFIVYGLDEQLEYAADQAELTQYWSRRPHEEVQPGDGEVIVCDFDELTLEGRLLRKPSVEQGRASMKFLDQAIFDGRAGRIDAMVTAPISKAAWQMAGYEWPGHTELLAAKFRSRRVTMMFAGGPLKVALASAHEGLFDLRNHFTIGMVFQPIDLLHQALKNWFAIPRPRIAVAGLNPHAGESGQFGDEEQRVIEPAIDMARHAGIDATGPYPADSVFWRALHGDFDGVVAMYHDQGLIPVKLLAFDQAVNITLGLPIIRTSPDHGTAYDIAGKNLADPGSMKSAIRLAVELALRNKNAPLTNPAPVSAPIEDLHD